MWLSPTASQAYMTICCNTDPLLQIRDDPREKQNKALAEPVGVGLCILGAHGAARQERVLVYTQWATHVARILRNSRVDCHCNVISAKGSALRTLALTDRSTCERCCSSRACQRWPWQWPRSSKRQGRGSSRSGGTWTGQVGELRDTMDVLSRFGSPDEPRVTQALSCFPADAVRCAGAPPLQPATFFRHQLAGREQK